MTNGFIQGPACLLWCLNTTVLLMWHSVIARWLCPFPGGKHKSGVEDCPPTLPLAFGQMYMHTSILTPLFTWHFLHVYQEIYFLMMLSTAVSYKSITNLHLIT